MRYVCLARLDGGSVVFLWEGGDVDRVVLDDARSIRTFVDEVVARAGGVSPERTAVFDLDAIEAWCRSDDPPLACSALLNAWNLFGDLPRSDLYTDADARANAVHRKLFYACNLPAVTPPGEHFVPTWDVAELAALRHVLVLGLAAFRARLPQ